MTRKVPFSFAFACVLFCATGSCRNWPHRVERGDESCWPLFAVLNAP